MQRKRHWWRYGALLASAAVLLQAAGCAIDSTTMSNVVVPLLTQFLTSVASGAYCTA